MSDQPNFGPTGGRSNAKSCLVFFVFAMMGPPPIGLCFMAIGLMQAMPQVRQMSNIGALMNAFGFVAFASYVVGGIQAVIVGVVAAIAQSRSHSQGVPLVPVLLASLVTGMGFVAFVYARSVEKPFGYTFAFFIGLHLAGGLVAWLLSNAILWPLRRNDAGASA